MKKKKWTLKSISGKEIATAIFNLLEQKGYKVNRKRGIDYDIYNGKIFGAWVKNN